MPRMLVQVRKGDRVNVKNLSGEIVEGSVKEVDESALPFGKVVVETDDGETVEVLCELGGV